MSDFWVYLSLCGEGEIKMIHRDDQGRWIILCKDERIIPLDCRYTMPFQNKSDKEAIRMAYKNIECIGKRL